MQANRKTLKRWLAITAGSLATYSALGFWLVPALIKHQIPKLAQTELARQASIGDVRFNPFTLQLVAKDFQLREADGAPLLGVGQLVVEMQWRSLVRGAWSFAEVLIEQPSINLVIAPDGRFNLAQLLTTLNDGSTAPEPTADAALPRLIVERFALGQGAVTMDDQRAGYANQVSPINFSLNHFSTLAGQDGTYSFNADSKFGGKIRWKGNISVNPIRASGELALENTSLPELAVYLKSYVKADVPSGTLSATLPYRFAYKDGKFDASLSGAHLALRDLAVRQTGAPQAFATVNQLDLVGIEADLAQQSVAIDEFRVKGGMLRTKRNAKGELDLTQLQVPQATAPLEATPDALTPAAPWKLSLKQIIFDQLALRATDATIEPPLQISADQIKLQLQLVAELAGTNMQLTASDAAFSLANLAFTSGTQTPFKLASLGFTEGVVDLSARRASVGRLYAGGGQLLVTRDRAGQLNLLSLLPKAGPPATIPKETAAGTPWTAIAKLIELDQFSADVDDQGTGVKAHLQDFALKLDNASSDLTKAVNFSAALAVREGGQLAASGTVVPASGAVTTDVRVKQLALAPVQPLLAQYLKLKLASGSVSAQGQLTTGGGNAKSPALRYIGGFDIADLTLNEANGETFAQWKNVGTAKLTASVSPNLLHIAELRLDQPSAKLMIEDDRSLNAMRLLVQPPAPETVTTVETTADKDAFPVRVDRVRLLNAKLDFTDLSLRPQFGAKIYELNGVINGLSSSQSARSQIELDGRVDEFGLARIRGELNPFAPRDNTDISVVFKNVDMVSASPYSMKFAGYRIAEGKISLDLQYKLRKSQLEGTNQIIIDKLTLGERVDSPDALQLPLELAIAILKDNEGRIDLGLPVSGNMDDPQFSYGAIVWKAIGNVLTKIVTAPFRALGALFGLSGEKMESIEFDPGSAKLEPPEREKLLQVAQVLSKRAQLKLTVPGSYSESSDSIALKTRALRLEVSLKAGIKLDAGENPGPVDQSNTAVRTALRNLYSERFGAADLQAQKQAAEAKQAAADQAATAAQSNTTASKPTTPPTAQKLAANEPNLRDASEFYKQLYERLQLNLELAPDALAQLGAQRSAAIVEVLTQAKVAAASVATTEPDNVSGEAGQPISLKLGLAAK